MNLTDQQVLIMFSILQDSLPMKDGQFSIGQETRKDIFLEILQSQQQAQEPVKE